MTVGLLVPVSIAVTSLAEAMATKEPFGGGTRLASACSSPVDKPVTLTPATSVVPPGGIVTVGELAFVVPLTLKADANALFGVCAEAAGATAPRVHSIPASTVNLETDRTAAPKPGFGSRA